MAFMIQFRCSECGRDQQIDLDDQKLTHIVCPNRECRHYAPKPDDELIEELHEDQRTFKMMNIVTAILIPILIAGIAFAMASFWPDKSGQPPLTIDTNAYIGFGVAFAAFVGIIATQVRAGNADPVCEY